MNAIIQPVHLILYTVFVSSALSLARTNMLYALVAISFLLPAEKFIKKMFGLDRAESTGSLGSFAGGALTMQGMQKFLGGPPHRKPGNGGNGSGGSDSSSANEDKINFSKNPTQSANDVDMGAMQALKGKGKNGKNGSGGTSNGTTSVLGTGRGAGTGTGMGTGTVPGTRTGTGRSTTAMPRLSGKSKVRAIAGVAKKNMGRLYGKKGQLARKAAVAGSRIAGRAIGVTGGALIGAAAGIATGDPTNILKYGTLGAITGNSFGNKVAGAVDNGIDKASGLINSGKDAIEQTKYDMDEQQYGYEVAEQNRADRVFEKEKKAFMNNEQEQERYKKMMSDIGYKGDYKDAMNIAADMKRENPNISDDMIKGMLKNEMAYDEGQIGGDSHDAMKQATLYAAKNGLDQKDLSNEEQVKSMNTRLEGKFGKEAGAQLGSTIADIMGQGSEYTQTTKNIKAQQKTKISRKEKRKQKNKK